MRRFLFLAIFIFTGCAQTKDPKWRIETSDSKWFTESKFGHVDDLGKPSFHPFFDLQTGLDFKNRELNFIVTTPYESKISYGLDVISGKKYHLHHYCYQDDIWKKYDGTLTYPPYTEGVVPRVLDQLGQPQKIIVFGNGEFYSEDHGKNIHRVVVVGGVIEQMCTKVSCRSGEGWQSRMVLIAVDPRDPWVREVKHIRELKKRIDWDYVQAFMQNGQGRSVTRGRQFPGFRVVGEISPGIALRFSSAYSHIFTWEELKNMRKSCHKLFDHAWDKLGKLGAEFLRKTSNLNGQKLKGYKGLKAYLASVKMEEKKVNYFGKAFIQFHKKFGKRFQTCTDFVRPSSINFNYEIERHWFFTYVVAFYKLQRLGYRFNCGAKRWVGNPYGPKARRIVDPYNSLKHCTTESLDMAFPAAVRVLEGRLKSGLETYSYIEYDNRVGGSHQKIYSWVPIKSKRLDCKDEDYALRNKYFPEFPKDIVWHTKSIHKQLRKMGIIY
ncbi:MAG: hypothetical protein HOE90_14885 [Bacteriovoracaceae bacterium]|jgi:hypothetical protein|nr:hypothetical protein [Bacteriovoracaceae bacterium]